MNIHIGFAFIISVYVKSGPNRRYVFTKAAINIFANANVSKGMIFGPVNSPHKGQWRGALMFSLICAWINDWVNNGEAGDLRRYCAHYDVIIMTEDKLFACRLPWYSAIGSTLPAEYLSYLRSQGSFRVCAQPMRDGVTPSLIGWVHTQNYPREFELKVSTQFN